MVRFQSKTKVVDIKRDMGWNNSQWKRFLIVTSAIVPKILDTDDYWTNVPKPKPLVWDLIPVIAQENILQDVNAGLEYDRAKWILGPQLALPYHAHYGISSSASTGAYSTRG
ncbi:hypothetical protein SLS58_006561 [Diplodia intermedia]|uniref:Uncharacterized protein n=1 Tax=Diplodia intermedia TaxID=856260 RepID=A0ABR3TNH6_9PEZI